MPGVINSTGALKITTATEDHTHSDLYGDGGVLLVKRPGIVNGRITLTSGAPVVMTDQTVKSTFYFTPYKGNHITIYDGSDWLWYEFTEKSIAVPAATSQMYDLFGYIDSGVLALSLTAWTNDTTRATALTIQDGAYVKSGATDYLYLGSVRTDGNQDAEDSNAKRMVWNYYNRVSSAQHITSAVSHTYGGAAWRAWNNDASTRLYQVTGVVEDFLFASVSGQVTTSASTTAFVSIGLNGISSGTLGAGLSGVTGVARASSTSRFTPSIGLGYLQILEYGAGVTPTFALGYLDIFGTR